MNVRKLRKLTVRSSFRKGVAPDYCNTGRRYIISRRFYLVKNQCRNGTMITYSVVINAFYRLS